MLELGVDIPIPVPRLTMAQGGHFTSAVTQMLTGDIGIRAEVIF